MSDGTYVGEQIAELQKKLRDAQEHRVNIHALLWVLALVQLMDCLALDRRHIHLHHSQEQGQK